VAQVGHFPTTISDGAGKYRLMVAGYSGDAGDAIAGGLYSVGNSNGHMFSTPDSDNDILADGSCAASSQIGWWFAACSTSSLNIGPKGRWVTDGGEPTRDVEVSHMLLKLN